MNCPTLIRLPISHYSRKVEWALTSVSMPYDARNVWFRELVDFRHVNPDNTVPVLEVDGKLICGSAHILRWISEQRPEADLYPAGAAEWETWSDEHLGPLARHDAYRTLYAHPTRYTRNPLVWLAAFVGHKVILAILKAYKVRRFDDSDAKLRGPTLTKIADQLRETGTGYLFAEHATAADFATAAMLNVLLPIRQWEYKDHPDLELLRDFVAGVKPRKTLRQHTRRASKHDYARWTDMPKIVA